MNEQLTVEGSDALLLPLLQARDQSTAERLLAQLIQEHADPIIAKILKSKLRVSLNGSQGSQQNQDALEIASELRTTLIGDLREVQQYPDRRSITSFRDYVAIKSYSACADYFREKNPHRWRLKNRLRYQLNQNPQFALWKADNNHWYAGLSKWSGTVALSGPLPSSNTILEMFSTKEPRELQPAELLTAIFERGGQPVEFERVVALAAEVWNITDAPMESVDNPDYDREAIDSTPGNTTPGVDVLLEQRLYLERLWHEVCELPVLQRAALLLNLRDGQGASAIFFLPHLGIASQSRIAEILELPEKEFLTLWSDLPLEDAYLAQMLGITRQQVINLRKTARERLVRRMQKVENPRGSKRAGASRPS